MAGSNAIANALSDDIKASTLITSAELAALGVIAIAQLNKIDDSIIAQNAIISEGIAGIIEALEAIEAALPGGGPPGG